MGTLVSGLLDQLLPRIVGRETTFDLSVFLDTRLTLVGFGVILYSLFVE